MTAPIHALHQTGKSFGQGTLRGSTPKSRNQGATMATKIAILSLAAVAATSAPTQGVNTWTVGQTVQTTSGRVQGHAASLNPSVSEYLGIPFAQPPLGDLRFAPPQALDSSPDETIISGADFGVSCLGARIYALSANATGLTAQGRQIFDDWNQVGDVFGEDCLTLNVWTKPQAGESKKTVMLFLYGGGFFTGGTSVPTYNGQQFAEEQDVVVVSANYRLNMFGYPGSPATQLNPGLLDIKMAIEWVAQNTAQFGGDPERIVIFGQSSGAVAADMLSYAFPDDDTVKGLILQSGTAAGLAQFSTLDADGAAALWSTTAATLGCAAADDTDDVVLACMRNQSAADLLAVQFPPDADGNPTRPPSGGGFLPAVDNATVFADYAARGSNFSQVPVLVGNNDNEGGIRAALTIANGGDVAANATTDAYYNCPAAVRAAVGAANALPTWRYRWFGSFPNTRLLEGGVDSGAWHGSELGVLFGTNQAVVPNTPAEDGIGIMMRGMWAAFAKDPAHGLDSFMGGVPRFTTAEGKKTLVRLGLNNTVGLHLAAGDMYDGACD